MGVLAGGNIGGGRGGGEGCEPMAATTHVKRDERVRVHKGQVGGRGKGGGKGREVGRQEGGVVAAELRYDRLGGEGGREVADSGMEAGADEAGTLIGSINTESGGTVGVRLNE